MKNKQLNIRVSDDNLQKIKKYANELGMSISAYVIFMSLRSYENLNTREMPGVITAAGVERVKNERIRNAS